jgi:hypothetical protein
MSFNSYETALKWAMVHGKENCLPCHRWMIVVDEAHSRRQWRVAIYFKSGKFVGYAE